MPLREDYKDQYDGVFTPTLPESYTIHAVNNWGYGVFSRHVPSSAHAVAATIGAVAAAFVTTAPTAGQIRVNYAHPTKIAFWECNSADNGKALVITNYRGQVSAYNSEDINAAHAQINANTVKLAKIPDPNGVDAGKGLSPKADGSGYEFIELTGGGSGVTPSSTVSPADGSTGAAVGVDVVVTWNKWLDDDITGKLKVYTNATDRTNDTNAVAGTLTRTSNKVMTFNPTSNLSNDSEYFVRLLTGLKFADGTSLASPVDSDFVVGSLGSNTPPGQVNSSNLTISAISATGYTVTLSAQPTDADGDTLTYDIAENSTGTIVATGVTWAQINAGKAITGRTLNPGSGNVIYVRAHDGTDAGSWSTAKSFTAGTNVAPEMSIAGGWTLQGTGFSFDDNVKYAGEKCIKYTNSPATSIDSYAFVLGLTGGSKVTVECDLEADFVSGDASIRWNWIEQDSGGNTTVGSVDGDVVTGVDQIPRLRKRTTVILNASTAKLAIRCMITAGGSATNVTTWWSNFKVYKF